MPQIRAIYHRTKETNVYPLAEDRYLIEAILQDEIHDVVVEVEVDFPALEIRAARAAVRNGPFTSVCNRAAPNVEGLVGLRVGRGFTSEARGRVGGALGCHRLSELTVEIGQAAYQIHFLRYFAGLPPEVRERPDDPPARRRAVLATIPGMRNTCYSYNDENADEIAESTPLVTREQEMPVRELP